MRIGTLLFLLLIASLLFSTVGLASPGHKDHSHDEEESEVGESHSEHDEKHDLDHSHKDLDHDDHKNYLEKIREEDGHGHDHSDDHEHGDGHDHGDDHAHGDGHDDHVHEYEEVPPNYIVLGSFGAINLAFLLYGAGHKLMRRRAK